MTGRHGAPRAARRAAAVCAAALCAAAAAAASPPAPKLAPTRTAESPAAIDVTVSRRVLAVHYQDDAVTPPASQIEAFNVLLGSGDIGRGDRIVIERGPGVLADTRARVLAGALAREGLRPVVAEAGPGAETELRLVVEHAEARVRGCPDWSKPPGNDADNTLHSDFGCATAVDLAAMVVDPRDLVEGRPLAPVVGDAAILALHRYRSGAPEAPEATGPVYFPDIDRQGRTTIATAPGRPQEPPAAAAPAAAPASPQGAAGMVAQAAAAIAGLAGPR